MAGLYAPLPTLRSHPRGGLRTDRGRRGLLILHRSGLSPHTPCRSPGALTRVAACTLAQSPIRDPLIEGFSHFVTSMTAPIPSGWSESPGGPCTHWKKPPCHGAHTRYGRPAAARWPRLRAQSLPPRSSPADRQQAVLQRFVRLQLGALAAENRAATIEHHGIFGEGQGKVGFLFGQDHRDPALVTDRR